MSNHDPQSPLPRTQAERPMMAVHEFERWIPDYVAGHLDEPELARFEEALLCNPEWASWVEAEQLLRAGLRELAADEPALFEQSANAPVVEFRRAKAPSNRALRLTQGWALAATIGGAALLWNSQAQLDRANQALIRAESAQGDVRLLRLDAERGITPLRANLDLTGASGRVMIEMPQGPVRIDSYRVRLLRGDELVEDIQPAIANAEGFILLDIPATRLKPGSYQAVLTAPDDSGAPLGTYQFDVSVR